MKTLDRIDRAMERVEGWCIIGLLWGMIGLTFVQVILRSLYTRGHFLWANEMLGSLDWAGPLVQLLVLWLTFLGSSLLVRNGKHINIDLFGGILPPKWLHTKDFFLALVGLLIIGIMMKLCTDFLLMEMEFGGKSLFYLPSWIGQIILPLGFALIFVRFLVKAIFEAAQILKGLGK